MVPSVDGSALVDEPGMTEGMTVARATKNDSLGTLRTMGGAAILSVATSRIFIPNMTDATDVVFAALGAMVCLALILPSAEPTATPPTSTTSSPTPVSADARSHEAPTKEE